MHPLKYLSAIALLHLCSCVPHSPEHFQKISAPQITTIMFAPYDDPYGNFLESVFLQWENAPEKDSNILYYTLLKKHPSDSLFDVFSLSRRIPPEIKSFNDPIDLEQFPTDGFDTLFYKIYAVDIYGRPGDTSSACTLLIAPQPGNPVFTTTSRCLRWESWIRGGQISYGEFWTDSKQFHWSSRRTDAFPRTDEPAVFTTCIPDTCTLSTGDYLYFVLYLEATDARSIKTGKILINQ
ncbi:MAG: hypothetical protein JW915_08140 [Chitinispirillaceae bacterium]|nr:hypothetical protein [Chitinispirillaceae bacterium]